MDACKKSACKAGHHYLLHVERVQAKARQRGRPPDERGPAVSEPTQGEEKGSAVQLVAQWFDTQGGEPCLIFWGHWFPGDPHHAQGRPGDETAGHPRFTPELGGYWAVRYKVPLIDTRGQVVLVMAYRIERIMSPLEEGKRAAFPEVPAGGLTVAAGEGSLLVGQDNLGLFPSERKRIGNAALLQR